MHADDEAGRFALTLKLLHEIDPLERGLTCALLVQDNATAALLADYLRREGGLPAVAELRPARLCRQSARRGAARARQGRGAHPGDQLAQHHLRMTPLGAVLAAEGLAEPEALTRRGARANSCGVDSERTMDTWLERLEPSLAADDAFSRASGGRQFTAASGQFDATGSREVAEFIPFMERHTIREP